MFPYWSTSVESALLLVIDTVPLILTVSKELVDIAGVPLTFTRLLAAATVESVKATVFHPLSIVSNIFLT